MNERSAWEILKSAFEIASGVGALVFIYQYFQTADQPNRQRLFLLLGVVAVVVLLALIGQRLLNSAIFIARMAARFLQRHALLIVSLLLAAGLVYLLLQRTQDIVLAGATVLLILAATGISVGAVRLLAISRPSFLGFPAPSAPTELELTYLGKAGDEVGPGAGQLRPDGHDDAVFLLGGRWISAQQTTQIDLFRTDSEGNHLGQHWTSSQHGSIWQLGVAQMREGRKEPVSRGPWIIPANEEFQFLLYASDTVPAGQWFTEGQWYEVLVQHDAGPSTARICLKTA